MGQVRRQSQRRLIEYDALRHRLWILGQRCHHGATGSVVALVACMGIVIDRDSRPFMALAATGSVLMAHDWHDRSMWFERGRGSQS